MSHVCGNAWKHTERSMKFTAADWQSAAWKFWQMSPWIFPGKGRKSEFMDMSFHFLFIKSFGSRLLKDRICGKNSEYMIRSFSYSSGTQPGLFWYLCSMGGRSDTFRTSAWRHYKNSGNWRIDYTSGPAVPQIWQGTDLRQWKIYGSQRGTGRTYSAHPYF